MNISSIFLDHFGRLRSGWRLAIFIAFYGLSVIVLSAASPLLKLLGPAESVRTQALYLTAGYAFLLVPAILVGMFCGFRLEGLPFRALGASFTPGWLNHLLWGIAAGAATLFVAVVLAVISGGLNFSMNAAETGSIIETLVASLTVFGVAAAFEEALFRGYPLQTLSRSGLAWLAIIVTSILFGLAHRDNPSANVIGIVNTMLAGVWFGVAYLKTRDLWFVWGLHLIWNWLQGAVFGIEVSGRTDITRSPVFREFDNGPAWLTGGEYGLEGGIACTGALILSIVAIHFLPISADSEMAELTNPPDSTGQARASVPKATG